MSKLRVLHCPTSVGGNPQNLARSERDLGLLSDHAYLDQNLYQYPNEIKIFDPLEPTIIREIKRFKFLLSALRNYDIIHFNFGQSLMPQRAWTQKSSSIPNRLYQFYANCFELSDLPLLKKLGKGIFVTYQGDDARQGSYCLDNFDICIAKEVISHPEYYSNYSDQIKQQRISKFSHYADKIYALNPDLMYVLPSQTEFLPYAHANLEQWKVVSGKKQADLITVLHAPSHRGAKGTKFVIDAVSRLKSEGLEFNFELVEGLPNSQARKLYEQSDLLVDQLLAGWYGGLAVELMALGKPVISYIRETDLKFLPIEMKQDLPIINANPSNIYEILKFYLTEGRDRIISLGRESRQYVEKWHDPHKIAYKLKQDYEMILSQKQI